MLSLIFPNTNEKFTNVIFSADGSLTSLEIVFKYMMSDLKNNATYTIFKCSSYSSKNSLFRVNIDVTLFFTDDILTILP